VANNQSTLRLGAMFFFECRIESYLKVNVKGRNNLNSNCNVCNYKIRSS
jgi:hypothetical protein